MTSKCSLVLVRAGTVAAAGPAGAASRTRVPQADTQRLIEPCAASDVAQGDTRRRRAGRLRDDLGETSEVAPLEVLMGRVLSGMWSADARPGRPVCSALGLRGSAGPLVSLVLVAVLISGCGAPGDSGCDGAASCWPGDSGQADHSGLFDGDGFTAAEGDCDDTDPTAHPGAAAVSCDGRDNDCDTGTTEPGRALLGTDDDLLRLRIRCDLRVCGGE